MPVCPACKTDQKQRTNGACPNCGTRVNIVNGYWFREDLGSPNLALLHYFEDRVSEQLTNERGYPVFFNIPPKGLSYKRELVTAERMIQTSGYDYELAEAAIDVLFDDKQFSWKTKQSLLYLVKDFNLALALAKGKLQAEKEAQDKENKVVDDINSMEDIFS